MPPPDATVRKLRLLLFNLSVIPASSGNSLDDAIAREFGRTICLSHAMSVAGPINLES
jgi:hypothetical protein